MIPKRRKAPKTDRQWKAYLDGVLRRHQQWVKGHECIAKGKGPCKPPYVFAHVRNGIPHDSPLDRGGIALKPGDNTVTGCSGVCMCDGHHQEQTAKGEARFAEEKGLDLVGTAESFNRRSPVLTELRLRLAREMEAADG